MVSSRRMAIRDFISLKRHTTVAELAREFEVSPNTISRDIDAITDFSSFYTTKGNGGGIHACEGWYASNKHLTLTQENFLKTIQEGLQTEDEKKMMEEILRAFAMPKHETKEE